MRNRLKAARSRSSSLAAMTTLSAARPHAALPCCTAVRASRPAPAASTGVTPRWRARSVGGRVRLAVENPGPRATCSPGGHSQAGYCRVCPPDICPREAQASEQSGKQLALARPSRRVNPHEDIQAWHTGLTVTPFQEKGCVGRRQDSARDVVGTVIGAGEVQRAGHVSDGTIEDSECQRLFRRVQHPHRSSNREPFRLQFLLQSLMN